MAAPERPAVHCQEEEEPQMRETLATLIILGALFSTVAIIGHLAAERAIDQSKTCMEGCP